MAYSALYVGWSWPLDRIIQDAGIRAATLSRYSHEEIILDVVAPSHQGFYGLSISSSGRDGGVREKVIHYRRSQWVFHEIPDSQSMIYRADQIGGARYDWLGAFSSAFTRRGREAPHRWFCSEACHFMQTGERLTISPAARARWLRRNGFTRVKFEDLCNE